MADVKRCKPSPVRRIQLWTGVSRFRTHSDRRSRCRRCCRCRSCSNRCRSCRRRETNVFVESANKWLCFATLGCVETSARTHHHDAFEARRRRESCSEMVESLGQATSVQIIERVVAIGIRAYNAVHVFGPDPHFGETFTRKLGCAL